MPAPKKIEEVAELAEKLSRAQITILADYRGLTVAQMTGLRRRLREVGAELRVVKNRLALRAAHQVGRAALDQVIQGPTVMVLGYDDLVAPAKALMDYVRTSRLTMKVQGGVLDGRTLSAQEVADLAALPSREVLVGRVIGGMQAPIYGLLGVLSGLPRSLLWVLQGRLNQLSPN